MKSSPRIVLAMADAMFEIRDADRARLAEDVMRFVASASVASRFTLRAALLLLRLAPLFMFASWRTLERMGREDRLVMLRRFEQTSLVPLALAFVAWRTLLVLHFYEDARELARVGYTNERRRYLVQVPAPAESGVRLRGLEHEELDEHEEEKKGAA